VGLFKMTDTEEEACDHAGMCSECELWYCLNDEIHHCYKCHDCLDICGHCSGLYDVLSWIMLCKDCYKNGIKVKECSKCNKYQGITRKKYPSDGSETIYTCRECCFKNQT